MVEEAVKSYRVAYERDESGWWVATVRGVRGCHTQGRTVDEARRRIREALGLFVDDARRASASLAGLPSQDIAPSSPELQMIEAELARRHRDA
jgi:predicted RNase H-like HicB family nuclease